MSSFFLKTPASYIKDELVARSNTITASKMKPWIKVTSNLSPGYSLSSTGYTQVFGTNTGVYNNTDSPKFKPNPIVSDFSVDFSARGTLRKATIKIECYTSKQFEEMQKYFMEPGISIFVQWGWNIAASTGQKIKLESIDPGNQIGFYRNFTKLNELRDKNLGCYDNMLGIVNSGQASISNNEFSLTIKMVSLGELLAGRMPSEPDTNTDEATKNQIMPIRYTEDDIENALQKAELHWYYFFNSLPDQIRNGKLAAKNTIPKGIDPGKDFINYDTKWMEEAKEETSDQSFEWNEFIFLDKTFTPEDTETPISQKKYIRFEAFTILFNLIMDMSYNTGNSVLNFKIDIGTKDKPNCLIGSFENIFSITDSVFIPNVKAYNWYNDNSYFVNSNKPGKAPVVIENAVLSYSGEIVSFPRESPQMSVNGKTETFDPYSAGWIGDIYIEHDIAMDALTNTSKAVKDVLDGLLAEMMKSVDNLWDFQLIEDTQDNKIIYRITDASLLNTGAGPAPIVFTLFGKDSVFLEGDFNFDIPKEISNQIVLTKTQPNSTSTQTGLRALFSEEKDMVLPQFIAEASVGKVSESGGGAEGTSGEEDEAAVWKGFRENARILLQPTLSKLPTATDVETLKGYWLPGVSTNRESFNKKRKESIVNGTSSSSPLLPLKINFTVLGISGFKFGDIVVIKGLPGKYSNAENGYFMVLEVTHKVNNSLWTTNVECMYRPNVKP